MHFLAHIFYVHISDHIFYPFLLASGFMWFILTLKKKMYKYQFGQYAWTHMILIVVFTQSSFTVANIFEGIFWYYELHISHLSICACYLVSFFLCYSIALIFSNCCLHILLYKFLYSLVNLNKLWILICFCCCKVLTLLCLSCI